MTKRPAKLGNVILHKWLRVPYTLHVRHIRRSKKAPQTLLLIHGLGSTGAMWQSLIEQLPTNVNVVAVDLLGFGKSPAPYWESYDARLQARSLLATYLKLRLYGPVTIVGHSLGALVAIEFAKRYPRFTRQLILCSPPIYRPASDTSKLSREQLLRLTYAKLLDSPELIIKLYGFGKSSKLDPSLDITRDNIAMYAASMRSSIINQTAMRDAASLPIPVHIIHGAFDPVVIKPNLIELTKSGDNISLTTVRATHVFNQAYAKEVLRAIRGK